MIFFAYCKFVSFLKLVFSFKRLKMTNRKKRFDNVCSLNVYVLLSKSEFTRHKKPQLSNRFQFCIIERIVVSNDAWRYHALKY